MLFARKQEKNAAHFGCNLRVRGGHEVKGVLGKVLSTGNEKLSLGRGSGVGHSAGSGLRI